MTANNNSSEIKNMLSIDFKIVDQLPFPVFYRTTEGIVEFCNQAFCRIIGLSSSLIAGRQLSDIMPHGQADFFSIKDKELLSAGVDQHYEVSLKYSDGEEHYVLVTKTLLRDEHGETIGIVGSIADISERKNLQNLLAESENEKLISSTMLQKIRAGIVIVNSNLKIIDSNLGFAKLVGGENEELFETIPGLKGADLEMLVPGVIVDMFRSVFESGESRIERDITYQNKLLSVGIVTIHKNQVAGALIRDLSAPMLERAEIIERAKQVNRKNMKTVQQIAYLLGENAAQTEELLNSIIESQKYNVEETQ
ncbi:MAG TPA: PAS domain S-box protein [Prolixibacteraceae bacterium]|nr:PAS domain S-box protein [Prolixibacteraceae bacterium]